MKRVSNKNKIADKLIFTEHKDTPDVVSSHNLYLCYYGISYHTFNGPFEQQCNRCLEMYKHDLRDFEIMLIDLSESVCVPPDDN